MQCKKAFPDVPMIGFKNNKNLNVHLVKSRLPDLDEVDDPNRVEERVIVIYAKV